MALPKLTTNLNHIQALSDRPNTADGLTSTELKQRFDQAGNDIKDYLNDTLLPELDEKFDNSGDGFIKDDDPRLTDSRKCNNTFDNPLTARENLKIKIVTSDDQMTDNDTIYLKYIA